MAITVVVEMKINPARADEFMSIMARALKDTRARQGNRSVVMLQDADNPGRAVLFEEWDRREDQESYSAWRQTPEGAVNGLEGIALGPPSTSFLNVKPGV